MGTRSVADTTPDELVDLIVGRKPRTFARLAGTDAAPVLRLSDVRTAQAGPVSLTVREGEILALVGLRGAGQESVGRCLFGAEPNAGTIELGGAAYAPESPREAMAAGVGLIPRDRVVESVATGLSIRENLYINPGTTGRGPWSLLPAARERERARGVGRSVGLRPNDPELPIESLSGGNQQKVVVGRWLGARMRLLIAEDPTAGVDVGAKADIYSLLNDTVGAGVAVLVISTDFEEVATLCSRALVFENGAIVQELVGDALTTEALVAAASAGRHRRRERTGEAA